jgi:kinesin family protein C2/C3
MQRHFEFDLVFGPETPTLGIWEETWPLIDSVFEQPGTSACVMAYGQTGAGKTFTMEGNAQQPGLISLALDRLFKRAKDEDSRQATQVAQISLSMLEVYQEQLRDLLSNQEGPRLTLRNIGGEGGPEVRELRIEPTRSCEEALSLYHAGARLRRCGTSERNSRSSRSHLVLTLYVQRLDPVDGEVVSTSKISLVDLAGSERQSAGAVFDRSRVSEASVINKSLTSLSKVV